MPFFKKKINVYSFWGRERQREQGKGRERGRHSIWSSLQAVSCQHRAQCRARTHELWDQDLSWSQMFNWLATQEPQRVPFLCKHIPHKFLTWSSLHANQNAALSLLSHCPLWVPGEILNSQHWTIGGSKLGSFMIILLFIFTFYYGNFWTRTEVEKIA